MFQKSTSLHKHFSWRPLNLKRGPSPAYSALLFFLILVTTAFISSLWTSTLFSSNYEATVANQTILVSQKQNRGRIEVPTECDSGNNQTQKCSTPYPATSTTIQNDDSTLFSSNNKAALNNRTTLFSENHNRGGIEVPIKCASGNNQSQRCSTTYPGTTTTALSQNDDVCPEYFRWIHEDLRPWRSQGITREMVEEAKRTANFRLVIKKGRLYVETYRKSIQTRDAFTIWGILQLLRRYPDDLPDLELMFDCDDRPVIRASRYRRSNLTAPPPLFRYCGDRWTEDIVFPDWSFWGWAEINIKPWEHLLKEMREGNEAIKWKEREPYAYWKGNPFVAETRQDLLKCNVSDNQDWNARLFVQDWIRESQQGFNHSNLANQCAHRYKIYIEGYAWSVSEKYILACDSVTLLVSPRFYDFFLRSLQPTQHYWPIRDNDKCKSIKYAVDWGNSNPQKAEEMGKAASKFMQEDLKMENVYDYMFHVLKEYAKLLKFEPKVPEGGVEVCAESMGCRRRGLEKKFMMESLVKSPSTKAPCALPPPFEPTSLTDFYRKKLASIRRVEKWEDQYWTSLAHQKHTH